MNKFLTILAISTAFVSILPVKATDAPSSAGQYEDSVEVFMTYPKNFPSARTRVFVKWNNTVLDLKRLILEGTAIPADEINLFGNGNKKLANEMAIQQVLDPRGNMIIRVEFTPLDFPEIIGQIKQALKAQNYSTAKQLIGAITASKHASKEDIPRVKNWLEIIPD